MTNYLIAVALIFSIAALWVGIQHAYRRFAWRHPEFGPAREAFGCGMDCTCDDPCEEQKRRMQDGMATSKEI